MTPSAIKVLCLLGLGASITLAGLVSTRISASAGRNQLVYTDRAEEGMTREEAIGVAVGAFRGVVVNYLWIRANELKQAGKYYEAVDLARSITRLQPRFPRVWAFHAWNLAYNISVQTQTQEERWQWVNAGIRLLRDEAIPKNPNDMLLHRELAWTLLHKVQGMMDDANGHYKRQFAREWSIVLGTPPRRTPEMRTSKSYADVMIAWLDRLATAPSTIEEVVKVEFAASTEKQAPPMGQALVNLLRDAGYDLELTADRLKLLEIIELQRSSLIRSRIVSVEGRVSGLDERVVAALGQPEFFEAWTALSRHLRQRVLSETYNMDVQRMKRYTEKYGPMDWRHPAAHSVYWSAKGVEAAIDRLNTSNVANQDFINTDRITIQSVQELFRSGTIMFDVLSPQSYFAMPNIDFIDPYSAILEEVTERERQEFMAKKGVDINQRIWTFYRGGYENFLHDAISYLYRTGDLESAKRYQLKLASWHGRVGNDVDQERIRVLPLEDFVVWNLQERITSPNIAIQEIQGALHTAYVRGLLAGDMEVFRKNFNYARDFHKAFTDEQSRGTPAGGDAERMISQMNKEFPLAAAEYFLGAIDRLPETDQALLYRRAPLELQQITFDVMDRMYRPRDKDGKAQASPIDFIFPEPPGMEAFRIIQRARQMPSVETGKIESK